MTGSRIKTGVIVSCQNYKIGTRTRIGMRRKSAIITTVNVVLTTIKVIAERMIDVQCHVERDRTTSTCSHRSDSNVGSGKRKVDHHSTRTDHQDMTGSRINTSVVVSCQNHKIGPRTRIGMRRQTATITTVNVVRTITEVP